MRKKMLIFLAAAGGLLAFAAVALAIANPAEGPVTVHAGDLVVEAQGGFAPKALPRHENAPITIHGSGSISTTTGELPSIIETLTFEFDRHGAVDTEGLEACNPAKLQATTVKVARATCPNAIVGEGQGHAIVAFAEQKPIPISSPITLFNGPKFHGDDTVIAHAYVSIPVPVALVVPIVIEPIHNGPYGYRVEAKIPKIAGGAGIPVSAQIHIGKKWTFKGKKQSYLSARCEVGHFDAKGSFKFKDGTFLQATFLRACSVRG